MRLIIIILSFFTFISMSSQNKSDFENYDKLVWNAMIQYKEKDYKKSLQNFKKAFAIIPNESENDYFYAAAAALNLDDASEAEKLIIESIKQLNTSKYYFLNFEEFNPFRSKNLFEKISIEYEKYQAIFFNNLEHPKIYQEIDDLFAKDQDVRNNGGDMTQTDNQNINRLIEITKKYGWNKKGWIVLWHQRDSYGENNYIWSFFKPYIDNQISIGKIRKNFWARFEDEKSIEKNRTQIYGMYWSQFNEFPIEDIIDVDKRRANVGLPPLWYMNKVYGVELPKEYIKTTGNSGFAKFGL